MYLIFFNTNLETKQPKGSYASSSHTHTKSQITDFPSSLPANGGNSDTVDGYHVSGVGASNLYFSYPVINNSNNSYKLCQCGYHTNVIASSLAPGVYWINNYDGTIAGLPSEIKNHCILMVGGDNSSGGFTIQFLVSENGKGYIRINAGAQGNWNQLW